MKKCCNCGASSLDSVTTCYVCAKPVARDVVSPHLYIIKICGHCQAQNQPNRATCWVCGDPFEAPAESREVDCQVTGSEDPFRPYQPAGSSARELTYEFWPEGNPSVWREAEQKMRLPEMAAVSAMEARTRWYWRWPWQRA
jgi:predicted amidophosphoribosyltransferase